MQRLIRMLGNADTSSLRTFLLPYRASSMFILSNMAAAGLEYKDAAYHGLYLGALDREERIVGVLVHYWNGNVMVQAPDESVLRALVAEGKKTFTQSIAGFLGPDGQTLEVMRQFGMISQRFALNSAEGLYELQLSDFEACVDNADFVCVTAGSIDDDLLRVWIRAYEIEALGAIDGARLDARVNHRAQGMARENAWVLLFQGEPVSLCGINARVGDSVQLGPVWTPPEQRNRGYARTLVRLALNELKSKGARMAYLFTKDPAAMRVYEAVGFKKIGDYRLALK